MCVCLYLCMCVFMHKYMYVYVYACMVCLYVCVPEFNLLCHYSEILPTLFGSSRESPLFVSLTLNYKHIPPRRALLY